MSGALRPLAIAMGDPAGIGPEIIGKAWRNRELHALSPFFAVGEPGAIAAVSTVLAFIRLMNGNITDVIF